MRLKLTHLRKPVPATSATVSAASTTLSHLLQHEAKLGHTARSRTATATTATTIRTVFYLLLFFLMLFHPAIAKAETQGSAITATQRSRMSSFTFKSWVIGEIDSSSTPLSSTSSSSSETFSFPDFVIPTNRLFLYDLPSDAFSHLQSIQHYQVSKWDCMCASHIATSVFSCCCCCLVAEFVAVVIRCWKLYILLLWQPYLVCGKDVLIHAHDRGYSWLLAPVCEVSKARHSVVYIHG